MGNVGTARGLGHIIIVVGVVIVAVIAVTAIAVVVVVVVIVGAETLPFGGYRSRRRGSSTTEPVMLCGTGCLVEVIFWRKILLQARGGL